MLTAHEAGFELDEFLIVLVELLPLLVELLGEELVEALLAEVEQDLSELTVLQVAYSQFLALEGEFESDDALAEVSVELAVLLLVLSLLEDALHHRVHVVVAQRSSQAVLIFVVPVLLRRLQISEHQEAQLVELLLEIVRSNLVRDESDLLDHVLLALDFFVELSSLFLQFLLVDVDFLSDELVLAQVLRRLVLVLFEIIRVLLGVRVPVVVAAASALPLISVRLLVPHAGSLHHFHLLLHTGPTHSLTPHLRGCGLLANWEVFELQEHVFRDRLVGLDRLQQRFKRLNFVALHSCAL